MTFELLVFLIGSLTFGLLAFQIDWESDIQTPSFTDPTFRLLVFLIGSPTFGLLAFQIDWESDIRTPNFADSESDFRTPSFSDMGSPTFGLLDTANNVCQRKRGWIDLSFVTKINRK